MKYIYNGILLQEVPNEISLGITLLGCPRHCEGCHSSEYWDINLKSDIGANFDSSRIIDLYYSLSPGEMSSISCFCFFGGDWNLAAFLDVIDELKNKHFKYMKFAWYTGLDHHQMLLNCSYIVSLFDYIKIGSYQKDLGGLDSPITNQRMYAKTFSDITYMFQRNNQNGNVSK